MLEVDLKLEKHVGLLSETRLDIAFNQQDLAWSKIVCLNILIEKVFNENEAIENLVSNGSIENTYKWRWSNDYLPGEKSPLRFNVNHLYVPPYRTFQSCIEKTQFEPTGRENERSKSLKGKSFSNSAVEKIFQNNSTTDKDFQNTSLQKFTKDLKLKSPHRSLSPSNAPSPKSLKNNNTAIVIPKMTNA